MTASLAEYAKDAESRRDPRKVLGKLADLLDRSGIPIEEIARVDRVNVWQGFYKDDDGEAQVVDMAGIQLRPTWAEGPAWPVVQPAKPVIVRPARKGTARSLPNGFRTAAILPDVQVGYRHLRNPETGDYYYDPFHDEAAMTAALEVVRLSKPDLVVLLGDFLDLAAQSKYVQEPSWASTTQQAIDRAHLWLAEIRASAPEARVVMLEGNHDLRLGRSIQVNAAASFGLQRANMPASWPVMSIPHLCRFDDLGVEYAAGYPANRVWVNDNLVCVHGFKVRSAGSTAAAVIDDERVSTIFGHVHRIELQHKTRQIRAGQRQSFAATPGCLCRIDGAVPSVKGGVDLLGRPLTSYENWQHGVGVVTFEPGNGRFGLELVPIHAGTALFRGRLIEPEVSSG